MVEALEKECIALGLTQVATEDGSEVSRIPVVDRVLVAQPAWHVKDGNHMFDRFK
jgi:hypothetical protein